MTQLKVEEIFKIQADEFIKRAAFSVDLCTIAKAISVSDENVRAIFISKLQAGNVFNDVRCLNYTTDWEKVYVYFDFDCPPDIYCFFKLKPAFATVIDLITKSVEKIIDPFDITEVHAVQNALGIKESELVLDGEDLTGRWPKFSDIDIKIIIDGEQIVLVAKYKGNEKYRTVLADIGSSLCGDRNDIDLFGVSISGVGITVYLRYVWLCVYPNEKQAEYKYQVWARAGVLGKHKLSGNGDIKGTITW